MQIIRRESPRTGRVSYQAQVYFREDGARKCLARTFAKRKDAERWARQQEGQRDDGTLRMPSKQTVAQLAAYYLRTAKLARSTRYNAEGAIARFILPAFGRVRVTALTTGQVREWVAELEQRAPTRDTGRETLAPDTVSGPFRVLRQMLNVAVADGIISRNPAAVRGLGPRALTPEEQRRPVLTRDEVQALLASASQTEHVDWNGRGASPTSQYALWVLGITTGARPGELLALCWDDVDLDAREVVFRRSVEQVPGQPLGVKGTKTGKRRTVALFPQAVEALQRRRTEQEADRLVAGRAYREYDCGGLVFADPLGGLLRKDSVSAQWARALKRAGLPHRRLYDGTRHTCLSHLMDMGVPLRAITDQSGHSTIKMLDRYTHPFPEHRRAIADAAAARMFGKPKAKRERAR